MPLVSALWFLSSSSGVSSFLAVDPYAAGGAVVGRRSKNGLSRLRVSSLFQQGNPPEDEARRELEFTNLEPLPESESRRARMERDVRSRAQFVEFGDELWDLRSQMDRMSSKLMRALSEGQEEIEDYTRNRLRDYEQKDPELVYMLELADMEDAEREGRTKDAEAHREKALAARSCLPHLNLDGLWVGKYGSAGSFCS